MYIFFNLSEYNGNKNPKGINNIIFKIKFLTSILFNTDTPISW